MADTDTQPDVQSDGPPKVLVVDDEPDLELLIRQRFRRRIRKKELEFGFAGNGAEALEKLRESPDFDLILTDINMPKMDGLTLLTKLPEVSNVLKAVIVSAYGDMENIRTAMNRGALDFLTKPIDFQDFEITLDKTLEQARQIRESINAVEEKEKAQQMAIESLERADRLKDEFLANTSHELRTPLHGIIGLSEALAETSAELLPPEESQSLHMIIQSGKRLLSLINDLLDFTKMRHEGLELQFRRVDLRTLTDVVLALSRPLIGEKPLELLNKIPDDVPMAMADENRLQQILHNLIGNAIKFTDRGEVAVTAEERGELLRVSVRDTGIGIATEARARIFKPFEQADGSISREYSGAGIGLAVSRNLVEMHGGTINVASEVGAGSTFTFTLPLAVDETVPLATVSAVAPRVEPKLSAREEPPTAEEAEPAEAVAEPPEADAVAPKYSGKTILVVDDEYVNLQVLRSHLKRNQFKVEAAQDGFRALELLGGEKPDLVLLDLMMPRMSGYEVCRRIRDKYTASELPVLILTAKDQVTDLVHALDAGANDYLVKPFNKEELLARIKTHLYLSHTNRAFQRFVPQEFLDILSKDSVVDIALGECVRRSMTVLFCDIRSFTKLSESISTEELFGFINSYLGRMVPVIRENGGFVDKYVGDSIMALFDKEPDDAVRAALSMLKTLAEYNEGRERAGYVPINIGIGINTGELLLGTLGEQSRMQSTVISEAVNLASRLEGMTKIYGASLLVGEDTYVDLRAPEDFCLRSIGQAQVRGKSGEIKVYEVFDADPPEIREAKLATREAFEKALAAYESKQFPEAQTLFQECLERNPQDKAARIYAARSEQARSDAQSQPPTPISFRRAPAKRD